MTVQLVVHTAPIATSARELREQRLAWEARRAARMRGPVATPRQAPMPASRPSQPAPPAVAVQPRIVAGPSTRVSTGWHLTDRGLAVLLVAFLLVVVLGGAIVGTQFAQFLAETAI